MRPRFAPALLAWLLASSAFAASIQGFPFDAACGSLWTAPADAGELYATKISAVPAPESDLRYDLSRKLEGVSAVTALHRQGWNVDEDWRTMQMPMTDVMFVVVTLPDGRLMTDSSDSVELNYLGAALQRVGDSLPAGQDASIGLTLPGTRATYEVAFDTGSRTFPRATSDGIQIAWAPVAEVNPLELAPRTSCSAGGRRFHPLDPTRGAIVGYNVYRIPDTGSSSGSAAELMAALLDGDPSTGWQYFADLRTFDVTVAQSFEAPNANDLAPGDLVTLANPDGRMYSSDEVLVFTDAFAENGLTRCAGCGTPPERGRPYWYAVQPVWTGGLDELADTGFTFATTPYGDHRMDLDGDGTHDAASLDTVASTGHDTAEFISPQAGAGFHGLGLTAAGLPLLSRSTWGEAPRIFQWRARALRFQGGAGTGLRAPRESSGRTPPR